MSNQPIFRLQVLQLLARAGIRARKVARKASEHTRPTESVLLYPSLSLIEQLRILTNLPMHLSSCIVNES